jgi:CspA family cold shock protein
MHTYNMGVGSVRTGTVTWYDSCKGFGFILPDNGGIDVMVETSAVQRAGWAGLVKGQKVLFDLIEDALTGESIADNLTAA